MDYSLNSDAGSGISSANPDDSDFKANTTRLVMCDVINDSAEVSKRFIELDQFKLWQSLALRNHNLNIGNISMCLWKELEPSYNRDFGHLYLMAKEVYEVNRLCINIYDEVNRTVHPFIRFALMEDTAKVKKLLIAHMQREFFSEHQYDIVIEPGFCFTERHAVPPQDMLLGLTAGI